MMPDLPRRTCGLLVWHRHETISTARYDTRVIGRCGSAGLARGPTVTTLERTNVTGAAFSSRTRYSPPSACRTEHVLLPLCTRASARRPEGSY